MGYNSAFLLPNTYDTYELTYVHVRQLGTHIMYAESFSVFPLH
jgi:hypothetical protein